MPFKNKEAQREYQRLWIAQRRANYFEDKYCTNCYSEIDLELDHVDPTKKVSHNIWSWTEHRRNEELLKCQVLCRVCHMEKTIEQMGKAYEHGTGTEYERGCKCDSCKAWKRAENKRNRKR